MALSCFRGCFRASSVHPHSQQQPPAPQQDAKEGDNMSHQKMNVQYLLNTQAQPKMLAKYPPTNVQAEILGYVKDINDIGYSRDIGRSFIIGGRTYFLFGDTFCKNAAGEFVGCQNNTAALVLNKSEPLKTSYLSIEEDGMVTPLFPFTDEEKEFHANNPDVRTTLWGFGGVVEAFDGMGLHWYQKGTYNQKTQESQFLGVGLAIIHQDKDTGKLTVDRQHGLLFGPDEPKMGSYSCTLENDYLYLYGGRGEDNILARVYKHHFNKPEHYRYWDGQDWVQDWNSAEPMFHDNPQGAIVRSELFGKEKPWVFVGVSKWCDSQVRMAAAPNLEGPWDPQPVYQAKGIDRPDGFMYCIYPHPWALDGKSAELMVTWSEQWPGGVVAAKLTFATEDKENDDPSSDETMMDDNMPAKN